MSENNVRNLCKLMSYRVVLAVIYWGGHRDCHQEFGFGPALLFQTQELKDVGGNLTISTNYDRNNVNINTQKFFRNIKKLLWNDIERITCQFLEV